MQLKSISDVIKYMNKERLTKIVLALLVVIFAGTLGYVALIKRTPESNNLPSQKNTNNDNAIIPLANTNTILPKPQLTYPDVQSFLPAKAILNKELKLDLDGNGIEEVAFAYAIPLNQESKDFNTGVKILKYFDTDGWKIFFESTDKADSGNGPKGAISIEKVSGPNNKAAVLVILTESGAGIATRWYLIASVGSRITKLDPSSIRQRVLAGRGYQDWGYNRIKHTGSFVIETQPGYSKNTARCCPDMPSIEMKFKFIGSHIELDSVKELEFKPQS